MRLFFYSDSDVEVECDLSRDELIKLVTEKEALLKLKHKEVEKMQDKVLRTYAEMENVMDRTNRNAESSKKFAIQVYILVFFFVLNCGVYILLVFDSLLSVSDVNVEFRQEFTRCC